MALSPCVADGHDTSDNNGGISLPHRLCVGVRRRLHTESLELRLLRVRLPLISLSSLKLEDELLLRRLKYRRTILGSDPVKSPALLSPKSANTEALCTHHFRNLRSDISSYCCDSGPVSIGEALPPLFLNPPVMSSQLYLGQLLTFLCLSPVSTRGMESFCSNFRSVGKSLLLSPFSNGKAVDFVLQKFRSTQLLWTGFRVMLSFTPTVIKSGSGTLPEAICHQSPCYLRAIQTWPSSPSSNDKFVKSSITRPMARVRSQNLNPSTTFRRRLLLFQCHVSKSGADGVLDAKYPSLSETTLEDFDKTFTTNTRGAFLCCKEGAKRIIRGGGGRIIMMSSSMVGGLSPGYGVYAASKAAVETMVKVLAKELKGSQITANCLAPGPVETEMFFAGKSDEMVKKLEGACPMGRIGVPKDITEIVGFLAGDGGEWINGQVIRANGGFVV